jgi:cytidine deaminase
MKFDATDFEATLSELPEDEQQPLFSQLRSKDFSGQITGFEQSPVTMAKALLPLAASFSVAPVSGFHVGAIAVGASGALYLGANLEFVGAPLSATLHAEQSAVLNAWMHGESSISSLAITEAPCGFCRQFLRELSEANELAIFVGSTRTDLGQLLPMPFGELRKLGHGLLDSPSTATLQSIEPSNDETAQFAIDTAQRSYAPYTNARESFVIDCANGQHFAGRTAESIAFNPSVPAVLSALNQRNLSSSRNVAITRCTQAKLTTSLNSSDALAASIIRGISDITIQTVRLERKA